MAPNPYTQGAGTTSAWYRSPDLGGVAAPIAATEPVPSGRPGGTFESVRYPAASSGGMAQAPEPSSPVSFGSLAGGAQSLVANNPAAQAAQLGNFGETLGGMPAGEASGVIGTAGDVLGGIGTGLGIANSAMQPGISDEQKAFDTASQLIGYAMAGPSMGLSTVFEPFIRMFGDSLFGGGLSPQARMGNERQAIEGEVNDNTQWLASRATPNPFMDFLRGWGAGTGGGHATSMGIRSPGGSYFDLTTPGASFDQAYGALNNGGQVEANVFAGLPPGMTRPLSGGIGPAIADQMRLIGAAQAGDTNAQRALDARYLGFMYDYPREGALDYAGAPAAGTTPFGNVFTSPDQIPDLPGTARDLRKGWELANNAEGATPAANAQEFIDARRASQQAQANADWSAASARSGSAP